MMVLWMIEVVLAEFGCTDILAASTCAEAIELIGARPVDAAMLDVNLGHETSYAVADILAQDKVPFLFSTGYSARSVDARFPGRPVITKPYRDTELVAALVALLATGTETATAG